MTDVALPPCQMCAGPSALLVGWTPPQPARRDRYGAWLRSARSPLRGRRTPDGPGSPDGFWMVLCAACWALVADAVGAGR